MTRRILGLARQYSTSLKSPLTNAFTRSMPALEKPIQAGAIISQTAKGLVELSPEILERLRKAFIGKESEYPKEESVKSEFANFWALHGVPGVLKDSVELDTSTFTIVAKILTNEEIIPEGSTVMMPTPTFGYYYQLIRQIGREDDINIEFVEELHDDQKKNAKDLAEAIRKTSPKLLILINPGNPHGRIYGQEELHIIAKACVKSGTRVICDEAFIDTALDQGEYIVSMGKFLPPEQLFLTLSLGKPYHSEAMRVSAVYGDQDTLNKVFAPYRNIAGNISAYSLLHASVLLGLSEEERMAHIKAQEKAAIEAIEQVERKLESVNKALSDFLGEQKDYIKLKYSSPNMICLLDFSELKGKEFLRKKCNTGLEIVNVLKETVNVHFIPGELSFIPAERMMARISLADIEHLNKAFDRISQEVRREMHKRHSFTDLLEEERKEFEAENPPRGR